MTSKRLHPVVSFSALVADELGALSAKGRRFVSRAQLAKRLHFSVSFLHLRVKFYQAVNKEGGCKLIRIILRKEGIASTLWAGKGLVGTSSPRQLLDTPFAVDMTTREDLWLLEVILADWTRNLLRQIFNPFSDLFWLVVAGHIKATAS